MGIDVDTSVRDNPVLMEKLRTATIGAKGMYWDGCHKIYLGMDQADLDNATRLGYDVVAVDVDRLVHWFDNSCFLRFVSQVHTNVTDPNAGYVHVIAQHES